MWLPWLLPVIALFGLSAAAAVFGRWSGRAASSGLARRLAIFAVVLLSIALPLMLATATPLDLTGHRISVAILLWVATMLYLWFTREPRWLALSHIIVPCLFVLSCFTLGGTPPTTPPPTPRTGLVSVHTIAALVAVGIYTLAGLLTVLYWWGQRTLKSRQPARWFLRMPALPQMELVMRRLFVLGFLPLTFTVSTGLAVTERWWTRLGHEGWLSIVGWLLYALVLPGRRLSGRHWLLLSLLGLGVMIFTVVEVHRL